MEVMQYPNNGDLTEPLIMAGEDVTLHTQIVNGYGDDSMKLKKSRVLEEEEEEGEEEDKVLSGEEGHKSSVYLDEDGEASDRMPSAEIGNVAQLGQLVNAARGGGGAVGDVEEVIELEFFERAIDKLHTHNTYCPNCRTPISKVILRIKRETTTPPIQIPDKKLDFDVLGCLACFRIFLPNKTVTDESRGERSEVQQESDNNASEGKCFDLLWFFGGTQKAQTSQYQPLATVASEQGQKPNDGHLKGDSNAAINSSSHHSDATQSAYIQQETRAPPPEMIDNVKHEPQFSGKPFSSSYQGGVLSVKPKPEITQDVRIPVYETPNEAGTGTGTGTGTSTQTQVDPPEVEESGSKSVEVVKSVVYGGLMESIASLSVVSSAAASGATTLNTVVIGVANLIGGSFVVAHNLLDLKMKSPEEEYNKVLGQRNHFLLHAIVAMLSYLIFGLAPPALYGFTFRQSDDRDMKLLGVAVASFVCVLLLAIGKAYISGAKTFNQYFVTIVQYATAAATASGVAYAVGHLFQKLMDELGWFNSTPTNNLLLPNINLPNPNSVFF
ncbi:PREDICTED: membrane protein of ER body-like protein isoform X2 [Ipomoea nil]|uniref:membrane protein of ER body-like protein isoform X2 n=1 Tax=Ipomoea nil TaxID=35883 RepID=UPI00090091EC|nr:PREDICTED: membrane protein of ER body-like protein isoform X2 [Ipomoea nil]